MAADFYFLHFFTVLWPPSFVLLLSHLKPNGIFHLTPSAERHPAFIFNIRRLLIIKGMYLNYKYTSYTEVGKAGIWPQAKFLHYPLFPSLPSHMPASYSYVISKKHPGIPLYSPTPSPLWPPEEKKKKKKKTPPPYVCVLLP